MTKCDIFLYVCMLLFSFWSPSLCYKNVRLQDNLCSDKFLFTLVKPFRADPKVTLTDGHDSGAIITQTWNVTLPNGHSSNKIKYDCEFRVQTNERPARGIYTVITRLKFRRDPTSNKCIDFIQFIEGKNPASEQYCKDISIDGPAERFIFDQLYKDVKVHIYIEKQKMIFDEPLELRMVLTAHSECLAPTDFLCNLKDPYSCISRHFVRDNITNCLHCRDEGTCAHDAITQEEMDTANVAISAITSLIFTMLGVGFCVWICWKYWNCITVQQHAHEASVARYNHRRTGTGVPTIDFPTAPPYDPEQVAVQHQQPATPKDLPPSYESLFPSS